jgi:prepilin signal peptidase PulO-like enzyme (type II secretory pathway)
LLKTLILVYILGSIWGEGAAVTMLLSMSLLPLLFWIAITDLRDREIPDSASLCVAVAGAVLWEGGQSWLVLNIVTAVCAVFGLALIGGTLWSRTGREWLGLGDAKLIGAGTMVVGADAFWIMLLLACVGAIFASLLRSSRLEGDDIPFGPFLAYSILVTNLITKG